MKVLLAALAIQSAAMGHAAPLKPSGPWTVEPADAMCIVGRSFGTDDQEITLGFRPYPLGEKLRIVLWFPSTGKKYSSGSAVLTLDDKTQVEAFYETGPISIKGKHLLQIDVDRAKIEALQAAKLLEIQADKRNWRFELGNVAGAMTALKGCETDLLVKWGMDRTVVASIDTPALHPFGLVSIFSVGDYPSEAIMRKDEGTSSVRFWIGPTGKVSDCSVVESSGSAALDQRTCDVITRRARYFPARTKSGESVASIGFQRIRWELP